tara:strand:+ start:4176 stop:4445 length:270 start_codon:yes stop_codon:yes gene_type:complete
MKDSQRKAIHAKNRKKVDCDFTLSSGSVSPRHKIEYVMTKDANDNVIIIPKSNEDKKELNVFYESKVRGIHNINELRKAGIDVPKSFDN